MRLVTFQDIFVLQKIHYQKSKNLTPIYFNNKLNFQQRELYIINKIIEKMKMELKLPEDKKIIPIWCWVIPKNMELLKEDIDELYNRFIPSCKNKILLELDIPNDGLLITNFDIWEKIFFNLKFSKPVSDDLFEKLFEKKKGATLQACIPLIHESFIKNVIYFDKGIDKDYTLTETEINEMIQRGEIELDEKGNIWQFKETMDDIEEKE